MKIITLCESIKFKKEITAKQLNYFKEEHLKKIELSDAILVIDINNYIGKSTNIEIEYAKKLGKEIIYYSKINK